MFIDSHAHIDGHEFDADRDEILERARAAGVSLILNVGTGDPHSGALERAVALGQKHGSVYTAIGTHPHDARFYDDKAEEKIKTLVQSDHVLAWGEIGLDFHYDNSPRDVQVAVFKRQLRAARECDLPVVIHTREAESETIEILKAEYEGAERRGVFHCFSGSRELAQRAIELGFMISFSGIVTIRNESPSTTATSHPAVRPEKLQKTSASSAPQTKMVLRTFQYLRLISLRTFSLRRSRAICLSS